MIRSRPAPALALAALAAAAMPAAAQTLFVGAKQEDRLVAVDLATGEIRARLETGVGPHEVAVWPPGRLVATAAYGRRGPGAEAARDVVDIFDACSCARRARIALAPFGSPHGIAWLGQGRRLVVTAERDRRLLIVDVERRSVVQAIETGASGSHLTAIDPVRPRAYVSSLQEGVVSVIDLEAGRLVSTVFSGKEAEGIAVRPDGAELWVTNRGEDTVSVFSLPDLALVQKIESPGVPIRVAFSPDGALAAVSNARSGTVLLIDPAARKPITRVAFDDTGRPPMPVGLLFHPEGGRLYVALTGPGVVAEIDLETHRVLRRIPAGAGADGMAIAACRFAADSSTHAP